jgi:N-acetylglucosamine kinase-like BadF-type ATPase
MSLFLGVDGGGSKTAFVLANDAGQVLAEAQAPSCYYFSDGIGLVEDVLGQGIGEVCRQASVDPGSITQAFFGLPSYGEVSADVEKLDAIPRNLLGHSRYTCDNDMVCGWAGSLGGADGINVISGTGSMTYGERDGRGCRVGGWGELFGDEGSAYWIAVRGLNAFTRMSDGRLPRGPLYEVFKARLGIAGDLDLIDVVVNRWQGRRAAIADLSKTVVQADSLGDPAAGAILTEAGAALVEIVNATRDNLGFRPEDSVPVSYSGGMFTADALRRGFERMLVAQSPRYELRPPAFDPGLGAVLYAAKQAKEPLSEAARSGLRSLRPAVANSPAAAN